MEEPQEKALSRLFFKHIKDLDDLPAYSLALSYLDNAYYCLQAVEVPAPLLQARLQDLNARAQALQAHGCLAPLQIWVEHQLRPKEQKAEKKKKARSILDMLPKDRKAVKPKVEYDTLVFVCLKYPQFARFESPFDFDDLELICFLQSTLLELARVAQSFGQFPRCDHATLFLLEEEHRACFLELVPEQEVAQSLAFVISGCLSLKQFPTRSIESVLDEIPCKFKKEGERLQALCQYMASHFSLSAVRALSQLLLYRWEGKVIYEDEEEARERRLSFDGFQLCTEDGGETAVYSLREGDQVVLEEGWLRVCGRQLRDFRMLLLEQQTHVLSKLLELPR